MLNDNYTAFCVNSDLLQCWRGRQNPSSLYQGIAQVNSGLTSISPPDTVRSNNKLGHVRARYCQDGL